MLSFWKRRRRRGGNYRTTPPRRLPFDWRSRGEQIVAFIPTDPFFILSWSAMFSWSSARALALARMGMTWCEMELFPRLLLPFVQSRIRGGERRSVSETRISCVNIFLPKKKNWEQSSSEIWSLKIVNSIVSDRIWGNRAIQAKPNGISEEEKRYQM